ncbi:XRE family transcriptional regulator (plasmid) [Calothrix sp. NIES-4071]|nr:XRE family transcriptional regulator [Calothrix sp. NIES-4071]BAZ65088.1 XRE family transcriptional regulator [Calothrix sp. NIES-4105]
MHKYVENIRREVKNQGYKPTSEQIRQAIYSVCPKGKNILENKSVIVEKVIQMHTDGNILDTSNSNQSSTARSDVKALVVRNKTWAPPDIDEKERISDYHWQNIDTLLQSNTEGNISKSASNTTAREEKTHEITHTSPVAVKDEVNQQANSALTHFDILSNFNPSNLDVRSLPSVKLQDRALLPDLCGVYFAFNTEIQYIGKTYNLRKRWISHHRYCQLERLDGISISYLTVPSIVLSYIEDVAIAYFKPLLNNTEIDKLEETKFEVNQSLLELVNPFYISQIRNNYQNFRGNDVEFIQWLLTSIAVGAISIC